MKKILIINQFTHNKGDRAILYNLIKILEINGEKNITISTSHPNDLNEYEEYKKISWGWKIENKNKYIKILYNYIMKIVVFKLLRHCIINRKKSFLLKYINYKYYRSIIESDLIISTGGHHFTNWFSKDGVSSLIYDLGIATLYNSNVKIWSQTIGPLNYTNKLNTRMIIKIFNKTKAIIIRDEESIKELKKYNIKEEIVHFTYDTVFYGISNKLKEEYEKNLIGISIYIGPKSKEEKENYIKNICEFVNYLTNQGYSVLFIPMQIKGKQGDDRKIINYIVNKTNNKKVTYIDRDLKTIDHMKVVEKCRYFIGHKTHSVIFALKMNIPTFAITYHIKTKDIMSQFGLEDYVINEKDLCLAKAVNIFEKLISNEDSIRQMLKIKNISVNQSIKKTFLEYILEGKKNGN